MPGMKLVPAFSVALIALALPVSLDAKSKTSGDGDLKIVSVDVEGGSAVLMRTPEGKSLLIDTGWPPGFGGPRPVPGTTALPAQTSADRITEAARSLGITKIDYLIMTHYHLDHLGGLKALLKQLPVSTFVDHGPTTEPPPPGLTRRVSPDMAGYDDWVAAYHGHEHIVATAGSTLDIGSLHVSFVAANGQVISAPLAQGGQPNPTCASAMQMDKIGGEENVRSLGFVLTFGKTRILYLGDLTWNKEIELTCPINKVGKVDIYFVTGHGMDLSSSPQTIAFDPLVAVMQNGRSKGGDKNVMETVKTYPNLQGFWLTHYSVRYPELNGDQDYIANLDWVPDQGYSIGIDVAPSGIFSVTNSRNGFRKTYRTRESDSPR